MERTYIAIDLKSFYASVECAERSLDPLDTNLVVADESRTEKTICLAVSPSLKQYGIGGRARLFEVVQSVKRINAARRRKARRELNGESCSDRELRADPSLALSYIAAPPRMALYMDYSARIYRIYLKYVAAEDIHVYSVDEVFMDVTGYLKTYKMTAHELAMTMIRDVLKTTGITATAGIGTNLYLCKIAMDIVAKHIPADKDGVRIAELDEMSYRRLLWEHQPITDFWRVGRGYAARLKKHNMLTMGDVALCSLRNEDLLYRLFGKMAELLIDHAWGREPCTIAEIKAYRPENHSISHGQVLRAATDAQTTRLIVWEMADIIALELVSKRLAADQVVLTISYDAESLEGYRGKTALDFYGRRVPQPAHGSENLGKHTSSAKAVTAAVMRLYDRIVDPKLKIRRIGLAANHVIYEEDARKKKKYEQIDLFTDVEAEDRRREKEARDEKREKNIQLAMLGIKQKYGKNAILKGANLQEGATARERNKQIGGHKA